MKEVLPTTLDAPTTQHICDGENEGRRCSQSWCFPQASSISLFPAHSSISPSSPSMEFQLPSITQGDLPVQKTNHQVSRQRVATDEVRSSVVALAQATYKVPSSAAEYPTGNGIECSTWLHWLVLPSILFLVGNSVAELGRTIFRLHISSYRRFHFSTSLHAESNRGRSSGACLPIE